MLKDLIKKAKEWAFITFMVTCPIAYGDGTNLRLFQERYLQLSSMILFSFFIGNIWLTLFVIWNCLSFYYNTGINGTVGHDQIINIFLECLIFMASRQFFTVNRFRKYSKWILAAGAISLLFSLAQVLHIDPLTSPLTASGKFIDGPNTGGYGLFGIDMAHGIFMTICLPILATLTLWAAPLMLVPIAMSQSSSVALAVGVVILLYTFYMHRKVFWGCLFLMPLLAGVYIWHDMKSDNKTFFSRFPTWHAVVSQCVRNQVGYGPDSFRNTNLSKKFLFRSDNAYRSIIEIPNGDGTSMMTYYSPSHDSSAVKALNDEFAKNGPPHGELNMFDNPHCQYLQLWFQYGLIGLLLGFGFLNELFLMFMRSNKNRDIVTLACCILAYLVTGLTHFPLELARTGCLFMVFIGAFYSECERTEPWDA